MVKRSEAFNYEYIKNTQIFFVLCDLYNVINICDITILTMYLFCFGKGCFEVNNSYYDDVVGLRYLKFKIYK